MARVGAWSYLAWAVLLAVAVVLLLGSNAPSGGDDWGCVALFAERVQGGTVVADAMAPIEMHWSPAWGLLSSAGSVRWAS